MMLFSARLSFDCVSHKLLMIVVYYLFPPVCLVLLLLCFAIFFFVSFITPSKFNLSDVSSPLCSLAKFFLGWFEESDSSANWIESFHSAGKHYKVL